MKILFWGRGVIGTLYAWAFENAGHTVEFYVREGKKAHYGPSVDVELLDARRSKKDRLIKETWPIVTHEVIPENHDYDLIFVSVNPEQVTSVVERLAPHVGNATVLFIGNFWRDIRESVYPLPLSQVVWGFPTCGGGREGNNIYGRIYKTVHFGTSESGLNQREVLVQQLFSGAGFKVVLHKDFQGWLRNHFIFNIAMEIEVLKSGSFEKAVSSRKALTGIALNTKEMIPLLEATGAKLDTLTKIVNFLPPRVFGFLMNKVVYSPKGIMHAIVAHNRYKVGPSVREMIAEARKHGITAPRLYAVESLIAK
jgi:2-dehydropantoate 2-reductase